MPPEHGPVLVFHKDQPPPRCDGLVHLGEPPRNLPGFLQDHDGGEDDWELQHIELQHDVVDVPTVIKTLQQNASNAQNMIIEIIKTFESFNTKGDPANDCLDTAIITPKKFQTKSTVKKLKHIAGRVLKK